MEIVARFLKRPPAVLEEWLLTKKDSYRDLDGKPDLKALTKTGSAALPEAPV